MQAQELYKIAQSTTDFFLKTYLSDFSDADLMVRPDPAANHCAWQLGHLIKNERGMVEAVRTGAGITLPSGFDEQHSKATAGSDNPADFLTKTAYLDLYDRQRSATLELITTVTDDELNKPSPETIRALAPTCAAILYLAATHPFLHCGQFAVVRRKLGKSVKL